MKKVYISCDMEGCSGIVNDEFCNPKGKFYKDAQAYMTGDLLAAIDGLKQAGVDSIIVNDAHWNMTNLRLKDLPKGVDLISGNIKLDSMVEGLDDSFDAVAFIGYHSMWGRTKGVIAHTYSGAIMEVTLNGKPVGESGIMGTVAGYYGVPVIFVSGDTVLKEEINDLNPQIHFAVTKEGHTKAAAKLYAMETVHEDIASSIKVAWTDQAKIDPLSCEGLSRLTVKFKETQMADMCLLMPDVHRLDPLTVVYEHSDYLILYRAFLALQTIGGSAKASA